jgi:hypothetical protein
MAVEEPSAMDYLRWLLEEVSSPLEMFSGLNENFATVAIEGALAMAGDSVDLDAVWDAAAEIGADVLPAGTDVWRATRAVLREWWHSFGYDYVLSVIHAECEEVLACLRLLFWFLVLTLLLLSLGHAEGKKATEDTRVETVPGANPEEMVDADVAKIAKEKQSSSDGFDDTGIVHDGASDDVEEGDRVEVWFWCALLGHVEYCLYRYFVDFVNFTCHA